MAPDETLVTARSGPDCSDTGDAEGCALWECVGTLDSATTATGEFSLFASSADGLSKSIGSAGEETSCFPSAGTEVVRSGVGAGPGCLSAGGVGGFEISGALSGGVGRAESDAPEADGGVVDGGCGGG